MGYRFRIRYRDFDGRLHHTTSHTFTSHAHASAWLNDIYFLDNPEVADIIDWDIYPVAPANLNLNDGTVQL